MWTRERVAHALLALLLVSTLVLAACASWRSVLGVDDRTYVEMVAGVRDHGLPYTINFFSDRFPETRARFNIPSDGKIWGEYPPIFAYVAAPALKLGGLLGITRENILCVGLLAIAVYLLGRRVSDDPLVGVAAAYVTLLATPVWASSFETLALPLLCLWLVIACYFASRAVESSKRSLGFAMLAGVFAGLAAGTHLHGFPMGLMMIVGIVLVRTRAPLPSDGLRAHLPELTGILRGTCAFVGMMIPLIPIGMLNKRRFGAPNPISYGPCPWSQCNQHGQSDVSAGALLRWAMPAVPWVLVVALALFLTRKRWWATLVVVGLAAVSLKIPNMSFHDPIFRLARTIYGYVVDVSNIDFPDFATPKDGLGHMMGKQVIKSTIQCSPILLVGLVLPPIARSGEKARLLPTWFAVIGQFMGLSLLARFTGAWAFGWPHLFLRYVIPTMPLLSVLAMTAVAKLSWRWLHVGVAVAISAVGLAYFMPSYDDEHDLLRRVIELRVTLVLAGSAVALLFAVQRWPSLRLSKVTPVVAAAAIACGVVTSTGVDTRVLVTQIGDMDGRLRIFENLVPQRFALAGWGVDTDPILGLRAEREIHYIDLIEAPEGSWDDFREIIDLWNDQGLPIYGIFPGGLKPPFRWPYDADDVPATRFPGEYEIWKIGPPKRRLTPLELEHNATAREERRKRAALRSSRE